MSVTLLGGDRGAVASRSRGMTSSAVSAIDRFHSAGSSQSRPVSTSVPNGPTCSRTASSFSATVAGLPAITMLSIAQSTVSCSSSNCSRPFMICEKPAFFIS